MLFKKQPMYCLIANIVESLKVSLIEWSFDNLKFAINPRNFNLDYLPFDDDQSLITRQQIYCIK